MRRPSRPRAAVRRALRTRAGGIVAAAVLLCGAAAWGGCAGTGARAEDGVSRAGPVEAAAALVASVPDARARHLARPLSDPHRTAWHFVPAPRTGLSIGAMTAPQRRSLETMVRSGLSDSGWRRAQAVVAHELVLRELELAAGRADARTRRDPALYFATVYGTPQRDSAWGWRFEGHHLSANATAIGNAPPIVAPLFMGANPARVPSGPQAGTRLFAAEEDLARALLLSLTPSQRAAATLADTTFGEIVTRNDPAVAPLPRRGVPASELSPGQRGQLRALVELYAGRAAPAVARAQIARLERAGFANLRFAWAGSAEPGERHYYRIHGPTLLIEYDNSQNGANHVHTVWRDLENDFGRDLLRAHYARHVHPR